MSNQAIRRYIKDGWGRSLLSSNIETETSFKLPHPFVPPCDVGHFRTLIYWDAYFTGLGLITDGKLKEMMDNIGNFCHVVDVYGYVPNGLAKAFISRSQPPFLTWMADMVFQQTHDLSWLQSVLPSLDREYEFWMQKRMTPIGLNRYGHQASEEELLGFNTYVNDRLKRPPHLEPSLLQGAHDLAEAESGWDFNPRFDSRSMDFCPVDLNAILYRNEILLSGFHQIMGNSQTQEKYRLAASIRENLMKRYMLDDQGLFNDYDMKNKTHGTLLTAASFFPYCAGINGPRDREALLVLLKKLEGLYGLSTIERHETQTIYQWDDPNMWPPLLFIAWQALINHGLDDDASRIAHKYLASVSREFELSGHLYEKYDVNTGLKAHHNEYEMTRMLGWTAGVFAYLDEYDIRKGK
ncbi:MAG: hypothetical protein K9K93_00485 [Acholeplasmataceae bacterium]|nr:hypothetical protein [Acholeplasmataceae bacterium]